MSLQLDKIKMIFENHYGENYIYRPFSKADTFPLMDATRNPEFNEHLAWDAPEDVPTMVLQVEKLLREARLGRLLPISVCDRVTGRWIGFIKYVEFRDSIEMSMWYHPEVWGNKVIFHSAHAIIDLLFKETDISKLYLQTKPDNIKLKRLVQANGFEYCDKSQMQHQRGHILDLEVLKVEKDDWKMMSITEEF